MNVELQESVLVVPRAIIDPLCRKVFTREAAAVEKVVLANCRFLKRTVAETDYGHKQIIPYVIIQNEDRYLLIWRTARQTEARLHNLYSLGIGGHINNTDVSESNTNIILAGMRRELDEEITVETERSCGLIGVINDDSTDVSRVHLGFVFLLRAGTPRYTIMEPDKYTAAWKTAAELSASYDQMESWARIAHDYVVHGGAAERVRKWEMGGKEQA
ncbi:MAG: NUDIX hydrolase [Verrucomicrobiota bacterium]|jgi:predicted NUDIX family phosphoesterase